MFCQQVTVTDPFILQHMKDWSLYPVKACRCDQAPRPSGQTNRRDGERRGRKKEPAKYVDKKKTRWSRHPTTSARPIKPNRGTSTRQKHIRPLGRLRVRFQWPRALAKAGLNACLLLKLMTVQPILTDLSRFSDSSPSFFFLPLKTTYSFLVFVHLGPIYLL